MASLDQTYTITLDTTAAKAAAAELNEQVDLVLAKIEQCTKLCKEHQITFSLSGPALVSALNIETDRLGRVKGR